MPTSKEEAANIFRIVNDYIGPKVAKELTKRLDSEVGKHTSNSSLKVSLKMLSDLYNPALHDDD
jgi:hypothetical protein